MKIRAKVILVTLALAITFSCESWMELIPPQGLVREEFWKTKEDVEAVVMGAYESFSQLNNKLWLFGEIRGDMVIGDYSQDWNERQIQEGDIYSTNWLTNWSDFYKVINYCNEVIKNASEVQSVDETFTDFILQGYLSEAYFLRSLTYFYLVRIYKDVPFITQPTESDDSELYVSKLDGDQILDSLISDLEEYRKYATIDGYKTLEENKGRATRAAFDALLADINLWIFEYDEVIKYCSNIEANIDYVLMAPQYWFEIFYPGNSLESIFELQFDSERSQNNALYNLTRENNHRYDPSQTAIDLLSRETSTEIIRGEDASIRKEGENNFTIWKYVGREPDGETTRSGSEQQSANFIIYRLADIKLMKAEAYAQKEMFSQAESLLQEIRIERNATHVPPAASKNSFEDAILQERCIELAFEGKRWFDLMRMGRRNDFQRKSKLIDIVVTNLPSTQKRVVASKLTNPMSWYLPIYEYELDRNQELEQNPYYNF